VQSLPGRLLLVGGLVKLVTLTLTPLLGTPVGLWGLVDTGAGLAILAGALALAWRVMEVLRRRLLWRVRRKLTLSYIFIGVVPAALIVAFFLLAGLLLFFNLSAYPGPHAWPRQAQVLAPDRLVLGLQLDGGATFARLLKERTMPLGAGDVVMLYTDGVSEAMNAADECFGEERLTALVEAHADLDAEALRQAVLDALGAFTDGLPPHDDMTLLLLKVTEEAE
jgi:hypothetical protein